MAEAIKEYSNDEVTVVWNPAICIHSEKCFHGLPRVFNPKNRPWININEAKAKSIIDQVGKCPSGALSIKEANAPEEPVTRRVIEVKKNGPYLIKETLSIKMGDGEIIERTQPTALCRCGGSSNKPFCDGTHNKIGFTG